MSRSFGMIITSIWGSKRFLDLPDDSCRLGYIYIHTNDHGNSIGAYRLPPEYLLADMKKDAKKAAEILWANDKAGLIQYDASENVVRIMNWFPFNPINSTKHLSGAISQFHKLPKATVFRADVAAEIALSAFQKAVDLGRKGRSQLSTAKTEQAKRYGNTNLESSANMIEALIVLFDGLDEVCRNRAAEVIVASKDKSSKPLLDSLNIPVSEASDTPTDRGINRGMDRPLSTDTETETHKETETETETKTGIQLEIQQLGERAKVDKPRTKAG